MVQEFTKNVQRLFAEIVADKCQQCAHNADKLLAVLQRKVTLPVSVIKDGKYIRLVYDNVTVELQHDLASMLIVYNSDYQMTLNSLFSCDIYQLSEFVLSLERDIPKWQHLWMTHDKLCKKRQHIHEQVKVAIHEMRVKLLSAQDHIDNDTIKQCRIKYYNLKACQLMLEIGNPFWKNKTTEQEIFEECRFCHVDPPMESWCEAFSQFVDQCNKLRDEKERRMEKQKRQQEKLHHLAQLKQQKFQAIIKTIEFHSGFSVEIHSSYFKKPNYYYHIHFTINKYVTSHIVSYKSIDKSIPKIIDTIKRINDIMPELNSWLKGRPFSSFDYYESDNHLAVQIRKMINKMKYSA